MKRTIKNICVISQGYPTDKQPWFPFIDQLLCAFSKMGVNCTCISPQSITKCLIHPEYRRPKYWERDFEGHKIKIYQPFFFSLSNIKLFGISISEYLFERVVYRQFMHLKDRYDVVYGHFWSSGLVAGKIGLHNRIPAFVACGESEIPFQLIKHNFKYKDEIDGVICVSSSCKEESIRLNLCNEDKCAVFPNAINKNLFCKMDKTECRKELGIPLKAFVIVFVGFFSERKGSERLSSAINMLEDNNYYSIFIGSGDKVPTCKNIIFSGVVPHEKIPRYLNAADIFVLPTLKEGCCNAIIEAMACGLPIISSNRSFNNDILDETNAILVDPTNIQEIAEAIKLLKSNEVLRKKMARNSLKKAANLTIERRAIKILDFMEERYRRDRQDK